MSPRQHFLVVEIFWGTEIWLRLWTWKGLIAGNMDKTVLEFVKFTCLGTLGAFQYFGPGLTL